MNFAKFILITFSALRNTCTCKVHVLYINCNEIGDVKCRGVGGMEGAEVVKKGGGGVNDCREE